MLNKETKKKNLKINKHELSYITFMATEKFNCVNEMGMEGRSPSHSGSSDASFHSTNKLCTSLELPAVDLRLMIVVVVRMVSR